ncbi:TPA: hypothetical protein N2696_004535 [Vibrio parahaemolyticus]|uniref:hypothetical protein n=1 Tax=Vibrio harveyi group TaxID=717610 RepID=UPI000463FC02|nr:MULTISPECIES: hypothetical protein [Vibrio harveyi group]MBE4804343.1 hypothetical protein [Vibrio parahaemolyticus]MCR9723104.1 hypothetical protein [Vibrio parahaemolyticus]MCR9741377.1 hypothetical protein [Vibrio parahaemolyticus]MDW9225284.1 hypothetical protein [Vibrio parahaemolyticus]OUD66978.1 hypothetical protein BTN34_24095 [Vibrio parahaemolyticus]
MPTQPYYELLEQLTEHQKKQTLWRWQIFQAAEMLRSTLSSFLGVDYLTYDEGRYRYVELLTPALTPFHLTADGVIEYIQRIPTVNIVIVVALELDSGMTLCLCPIQIRLAHKKIEYRITKEGGRWISDPQIMLKWVYQTLKRNIAKLPTSNSTPSYFLHKNAQESLELLINTPQKANQHEH